MNGKKRPPAQEAPNWTSFIWIALVAILLLSLFRGGASDHQNISYTQFLNEVNRGNVAEITAKGDHITGVYKQPIKTGPKESPVTFKEFETTVPEFAGGDLLPILQENEVVIGAEQTGDTWLTTILIGFLPWLLIIGFFVYTSRKMRGMGGLGGGGPFGFGQSKAKRFTKSSSKVTFDDVAGLTNAKKEIEEIIDFLRDPSRFRSLGGKLPKGVLLAGPPGTGKTLFARAAAGEANVPFYSISGSEFIEMFVGVGASRVRDMFEKAKKDSPSIIFVDEIDSIGRVRGTGLGGGHDEREQTLNQILSEMDGFSPNESVVVMAATNRPDILDPALVRPGRFDRRITLDLPQKKARKEILEIHAAKIRMSPDVDLENMADMTVGFSGADLENLVNEAALLAARKKKKQVENDDFEESRDKVIMGVVREDLISQKEKKAIAYHEAGHALLAKLLPGVDPLQKVTIIPRGRALGATEQIPIEDRHNLSRTYLLNRVAIMLGGRVAEKLVFSDVTTGAGDDLKKATQIVRRMVCQWGMSEKIGPVTFKQGDEHPFVGREISEPKDFSEHTARLIDEEVRSMLTESERKAEEALKPNRIKLDAIAQGLMDYETLDNHDVDRILRLEGDPKEQDLAAMSPPTGP
jgi:cell division protease FtsH